MAELLTDEDVFELTGVEQSAAQIRVLREHGIYPVIRRDGRPRVTWAAVTAAMSGGRQAGAEPDFTSLRQSRG